MAGVISNNFQILPEWFFSLVKAIFRYGMAMQWIRFYYCL